MLCCVLHCAETDPVAAPADVIVENEAEPGLEMGALGSNAQPADDSQRQEQQQPLDDTS